MAIEPSGDVEAMLALLESGQPLPPDPREANTTREDAAAFTARLDKIVARYESQFLKRHEWRVCIACAPSCAPLNKYSPSFVEDFLSAVMCELCVRWFAAMPWRSAERPRQEVLQCLVMPKDTVPVF